MKRRSNFGSENIRFEANWHQSEVDNGICVTNLYFFFIDETIILVSQVYHVYVISPSSFKQVQLVLQILSFY